MPFCAVRTCGEKGQFACKKSDGQIICFHQFPPERDIKTKWIKATGQRKTSPSWRPTKDSTICSKHFKKQDFLDCTNLKISAVPISEEEREFLDGLMKDSGDNSDTLSVDDIIELPQHNQSTTNKELTEEDEEIPIEPVPTTSPDDQPESDQPIAVQDSEPEFTEKSSELEFTEVYSSEVKSGQLTVDAIENPKRSDEQPAYGMKISKAYTTRKRCIEHMTGQRKTNVKMYRIDPVTNYMRPVTSIPKDGYIIDSEKPPVLVRQNRDSSGKQIYVIKKSTESLDGDSKKTKASEKPPVLIRQNRDSSGKKIYVLKKSAEYSDSQKSKANQNCSSQVQYANSTTKNIAPETGSDSNRIITLSVHSEKPKVYSTPIPKVAQMNQEMHAKEADSVHTIRKATPSKPIIKNISPSANTSIAPDGCGWPQLKLAPWNISKPKLPRLAPKPTIRRPINNQQIINTSVATPADSMPTLTVSTPSPAYSMPTPSDSTPTPADSTRTPADSTRTLADSITISADLTPTPADSMLTPADSVSIPAVLSRAVQLDDSNIHTLDEYDTFAKHIATQLRQLSLKSYLSAQAEIQGTISKYRLRDLIPIKKKHKFVSPYVSG